MNDPIPKNTAVKRGRRVLDLLLSDGLWQVCLVARRDARGHRHLPVDGRRVHFLRRMQ